MRTAPNWAVARENLGDVYARLAAAEYDRAAKLDQGNKTAPAKLTLVRSCLTVPPSETPPKPVSRSPRPSQAEEVARPVRFATASKSFEE